jgi:hypothetical protein
MIGSLLPHGLNSMGNLQNSARNIAEQLKIGSPICCNLSSLFTSCCTLIVACLSQLILDNLCFQYGMVSVFAPAIICLYFKYFNFNVELSYLCMCGCVVLWEGLIFAIVPV